MALVAAVSGRDRARGRLGPAPFVEGLAGPEGDRARRLPAQAADALGPGGGEPPPGRGVLERGSTQPGTVMAYESVDLFSEASGYLKRQTVDIGDVVKKGAP